MLAAFAIGDMLQRVEEQGAEPIIWASFDDSTTRNDKDPQHLEALDWVFVSRDYPGTGGQGRSVRQWEGKGL